MLGRIRDVGGCAPARICGSTQGKGDCEFLASETFVGVRAITALGVVHTNSISCMPPALVGVRFTEHPATIPRDTLGDSQNFQIAYVS